MTTPKTNSDTEQKSQTSLWAAAKKLLKFIKVDTRSLVLVILGLLFNSFVQLATPYAFGHVVDAYISTHQYAGIFTYAAILLAAFVIMFFVSYFQMMLMGTIGQNVLFSLRNNVFTKLQSLPISFFHQTKAGDLISRINNDTDKLNQFFSETLMRFFGSIFIIIGAGILIVVLHPTLGLTSLIPAVVILIVTQLFSSWVKTRNKASLKSVGGLSAEIQESLDNFKVIVAFNRRDYFRARFNEANQKNFDASVKAGISNGIFSPIYDFASNFAQLTVVGYGIILISQGRMTIGLLLTFLIYVERFYTPLRHLASLWSSLQLAMAGWDRISEILENESHLPLVASTTEKRTGSILEFKNVSFNYPDGKTVLKQINFDLAPGKTYALVGPTGGGKTTTASLMARLYDATEGEVLLNGKDIRSYSDEERTNQIGFILQEPFLFTGSLMENIFHGNSEYAKATPEEQKTAIKTAGLDALLERFQHGLETQVEVSANTMSLGQRQLIAFMRAVLRKPELLILDEATANIDTVTEQLLEETLQKLPAHTTKVIIAHRLNTIENADEIFFVNSGTVTAAGSLSHAVELLMDGKRES